MGAVPPGLRIIHFGKIPPGLLMQPRIDFPGQIAVSVIPVIHLSEHAERRIQLSFISIMMASLIPQESGNRVKTDRKDSRKLAYLLAKGLLKRIFVPSKQEYYHRQVVRRRGD